MNARLKTLLISAVFPLAFALMGCQQAAVRGKEGSRMVVTVPYSLTVNRGKAQAIQIDVERSGFTDPLDVAIEQLPAGVKADSASKRIETDKATFLLTAAPDAVLVANHQVKVTTSRPGGFAITQSFPMTVKE